MFHLKILLISFLLFNHNIHAFAIFSSSSSSNIQRNKPSSLLSWKISNNLLLKNNRYNVLGERRWIHSPTSLFDLRGGGDDDKSMEEGVEDNGDDDNDFDQYDDILPPSLRALVDDTISSQRKIIVVTGGVLSGIGKGVTASSIGVLLRAMGLRVTALKIDPYLNVDAGTMSPFEHGEVFVLDDGGETDLDLGNYERFLSVSLTKESNLSTGKIYQVSS